MMPTLASVIGQDRAREFLLEAMRAGRMSHALLFLGPKGIGRTTLALAVLSALNCPRFEELGDACGACQSCRLIDERKYPYLRFLRPETAEIKVDQVRALENDISLMLPEGAHQMVIVEPAEKLNPSSSNALLKILEEPPVRTYFVLIAENELKLLPTIRSRCQKIYLDVPRGKFLEQLLSLKGRSGQEAEILGRLSRASSHLGLSASSDFVSRIRPAIFEVLDSLLVGTIDPFEAAERIVSLLRKYKGDEFTDALELIKSVFRDIGVLKVGGGFDMVGNSDKSVLLKRAAAAADVESIGRCFVAASKAQRAIEGYANPQLVFEELMIKIAEYIGSEKRDAD